MEIWKEIEEYCNYSISNRGRVLNKLTNRILKPSKDGCGYLFVNLFKDKKPKAHYIHRLVAKYFLNHTFVDYNKIIDHIDNDRNNNNFDNLQIISNRENTSKDIDKSKTSSKYVGVYWYAQRNKWKAVAKIKGKIIYIGLYSTELEAHKAYQTKITNETKV